MKALNVSFHTADASDTEAVALIDALVQEMGKLYPDEALSKPVDPRDFRLPQGKLLVARRGDRAVACGGVRRFSETDAELKRMYVLPEFRGKGIARQLLRHLEATAAEMGFENVRLETGTNQRPAMRLYESSGYYSIKPYGEFKESPTSVCYRKSLTGI